MVLEEQMFTIKQVATKFEVQPATVRLWIKNKKMRGIRLGNGQLRVPISALEEFAQELYGGK